MFIFIYIIHKYFICNICRLIIRVLYNIDYKDEIGLFNIKSKPTLVPYICMICIYI